MTELFLKIVNMGISASWLVLAVLVIRLIFKKVPKWATVLLWGIVAVRLLIPFSIESVLSLIPSAETIAPEIMTDTEPTISSGIYILNSTMNPIITETFAPVAESSVNPLEFIIPALACGWAAGVGVLLVYTASTYLRLRIRVRTAVRLRDNVFQSESVSSPFVFGVVKPKIYVPFNMDEDALEMVLAHEQAHIRRKDHLWKPLGFLLLTVHWFNPLMWLAYVLLCKDIELACDEKVIKGFDNGKLADYSQALLECSVSRGTIAACPLCFGEVSTKQRIKSVLNYKKPAFWLIVTSVIICIAVGICFLTNPIPENDPDPVETVEPSMDPTLAEAASWAPLSELLEDYDWMQARDDGCVMLYADGESDISEGERQWIDFVNASYSGNPAIVRMRFDDLDSEDYWMKDLRFDGEKYILQYYDLDDITGNSTFVKEEYKYLVRFGSVTNENNVLDNYLLTDTPAEELSQEMLESGDYGDGNLIYSAQVPHDYMENSCYGTVYIDIDNFGDENKCCLGRNTSLDKPNFTLNVYYNDLHYELGYQNVYSADFDYVCFVQDEDGNLMVQGVKQGDEPETHTYEIIPIHWYQVGLLEKGEMLETLNVF